MKLILICSNCGTVKELGDNKQFNHVESYDVSNNSDFRFEISGSIDGVDDVQEMTFDESDLSIEDMKVEFKCVRCNSSLMITE